MAIDPTNTPDLRSPRSQPSPSDSRSAPQRSVWPKASRFFHAAEVHRPEDVIPYLAEQERHWRKGYSAYELAHTWISSGGIPQTVRTVLETCSVYRGAALIEGLFEREVHLRTPGRPSQTDLLAYVKADAGHAVFAVEGKVDEPFGQLVSDWHDRSEGRIRRLNSLCAALGLVSSEVENLRYQLLHRTVSALYEAERYRCTQALMLVHSFSPGNSWLDDFLLFSRALSIPIPGPGFISRSKAINGIDLRLAWVSDTPSA